MALTYATMGAIVKASEQSRKPAPVVLSGESIPSRVTPVNGATVRTPRRSNGLDTALSRLVIIGSNPIRGTEHGNSQEVPCVKLGLTLRASW